MTGVSKLKMKITSHEIFKVHITPLTKFRPENPCGVKRSHKKIPETDLAFPYN